MQNTVAQQPDLSPTAIRHAVLANGYKPIPVNGKRPQLKGWQQLSPTTASIDAWERGHADHANTGILTGEVVAIDIDAPDPIAAEKLIAALMQTTGAMQAPCRTGRAPKCLFIFRATEPRKKAATPVYLVNGEKCQIEVLGAGQQFVAYGSHPDTQQPYTWASGDPMAVPFKDLPEITPAQVDDYLSAAEAILADLGELERKAAPVSARASSGSTFWTRVNAAALENTDAWVRLLFSTAHKESGTGAWRVTSKELGRGLQEDISIHADGIQDFGEERGLTPIDLVREYGGAASAKDAAFWLCEQLGRSPSDLGWEVTQPVKLSFSKIAAQVEAANDDDEEAEVSIPQPDAGGLPLSLCYPPGAVGEIAKFIVSCSRFPSPHLSLASSLAFVSALIGRRYKGPTGLRSNIYVIGLAESGFGKDITIRAVQSIASSTVAGDKVTKFVFSDKIASLAGLANKLRRAPACLAQQDEFGKFIRQYMGEKAPAHREEVATALLELTGAASGLWGGQEKADGNVKSIQNPCFSVHGVSTPSTFWSALTGASIDEGLLGRFVLIDAGDRDPKKVRRPENSHENVPQHISDAVWELLGGVGRGQSLYQGPFFALNADSETKPHPIVTVEYASSDVDDFFEEFDDSMRAMKKKVKVEYAPICNRVGENAARLALIVAVGANPREPIITMEIQQWANAVAEHSFKLLLKGADENVADNHLSAEYIRVRNMVIRRGKAGLPHRELKKNLQGGIRTQRLAEILDDLIASGDAKFMSAPAKSGQTQVRWWARGFFPEGATGLEVGA
ncbi:bifunctional DNA primase/polymerase [Ochrobactrum soli]|uniref:DNA primase/helicase, phage-associated n=1 Tax=Ochrobactrum soli TaxID=2448455 RepID=A0A2P9HHZ7_9HYPH|nr:bifunctional DNA primase/polymerase [[Ochrobactrum] soli]SPL63726.1 DNA primase/helicase, phage-associated [[Ochrobactrum] soli]